MPVYIYGRAAAAGQPAPHYASRTLAAAMAASGLLKYVLGGSACQIASNETWARLKERHRGIKSRRADALKAPRPSEDLLLFYPAPALETDGRRRRRELWRNATRF